MAKSVTIVPIKIKQYWAKTLIEMGKTLSLDLDLEDGEHNEENYIIYKTQNFCFACGLVGEVQRAHILARQDGGNDNVENLHLLCLKCHVESEYMKEELYWHWFKNKDMNKAYFDREDLRVMKAKFIESRIRAIGLSTKNLSVKDVEKYISIYQAI